MAKTVRSKCCEFSKKEREAIKARDSIEGVPVCIVCGTPYRLQIAHYIPRSAGGFGIRQNGVVLCDYHHRLLDQGADREKREKIRQIVKKRLSIYEGFTDDMRRYRKGTKHGSDE